MKKSLLIAAAIVVFGIYNYGLYQWLLSGHSFKDIWLLLTSDWLLAITVLDMCIFSLLCLIWLYQDMSRRELSRSIKFFMLFASLIVGVVVLLLYLAFRKKTSSHPLEGNP